MRARKRSARARNPHRKKIGYKAVRRFGANHVWRRGCTDAGQSGSFEGNEGSARGLLHRSGARSGAARPSSVHRCLRAVSPAIPASWCLFGLLLRPLRRIHSIAFIRGEHCCRFREESRLWLPGRACKARARVPGAQGDATPCWHAFLLPCHAVHTR